MDKDGRVQVWDLIGWRNGMMSESERRQGLSMDVGYRVIECTRIHSLHVSHLLLLQGVSNLTAGLSLLPPGTRVISSHHRINRESAYCQPMSVN